MLKQRVWAIEIRPYTVEYGVSTPYGPTKIVYGVTISYAQLRGNKEGMIILDPSPGYWTEWSRSYSFQELREKSKEAIAKFGQDNVRIIEIHNIETITLPNA